MKKGISLIVLVITIIVMIILAASVVITLNNSGVMDKANDATRKQNEAQLNTMVNLAWSEAYLKETAEVKDQAYFLREVKEYLKNNNITDEMLEDFTLIVTTEGASVTVGSSGDSSGGSAAAGFTVNGRTCYATDGMTWESWLKSSYNVTGLTNPVILNGSTVIAHNTKISNGTSYYLKTYALSGKWTFNKNLDIKAAIEELMPGNEDREYGVNINYGQYLYISLDKTGDVYTLFYGNDGLADPVYRDGAWWEESYRTIDFGTVPQAVSTEFYNWFIRNAVPEINGDNLSYALAGTWKIKDNVNCSTANYADIKYISDGVQYNGMGSYVNNGAYTYSLQYSYYDFRNNVAGKLLACGYNNSGRTWAKEQNKTIYFGDEAQAVNTAFYNWFIENAEIYTGGFETTTISGKWKFKDEPDLQIIMYDIYNSFAENVNFVSNGVSYNGIYTYRDAEYDNYSLLYAMNNDAEIACYWSPDEWSEETHFWNDEGYKTIDFGSTSQQVTTIFYNWLIENAVRQ